MRWAGCARCVRCVGDSELPVATLMSILLARGVIAGIKGRLQISPHAVVLALAVATMKPDVITVPVHITILIVAALITSHPTTPLILTRTFTTTLVLALVLLIFFLLLVAVDVQIEGLAVRLEGVERGREGQLALQGREGLRTVGGP